MRLISSFQSTLTFTNRKHRLSLPDPYIHPVGVFRRSLTRCQPYGIVSCTHCRSISMECSVGHWRFVCSGTRCHYRTHVWWFDICPVRQSFPFWITVSGTAFVWEAGALTFASSSPPPLFPSPLPPNLFVMRKHIHDSTILNWSWNLYRIPEGDLLTLNTLPVILVN